MPSVNTPLLTINPSDSRASTNSLEEDFRTTTGPVITNELGADCFRFYP